MIAVSNKKIIKIQHTGPGADIRIDLSKMRGAGDYSLVKTAGEIIARRMYGRRGVVGSCRPDSVSDSYFTYEIFVGVHADRRTKNWRDQGITGQNVWLYIPRS